MVFSASFCAPTLSDKKALLPMGKKQADHFCRELASYRKILKTYLSVARELFESVL